jgi:hypothetical protein
VLISVPGFWGHGGTALCAPGEPIAGVQYDIRSRLVYLLDEKQLTKD